MLCRMGGEGEPRWVVLPQRGGARHQTDRTPHWDRPCCTPVRVYHSAPGRFLSVGSVRRTRLCDGTYAVACPMTSSSSKIFDSAGLQTRPAQGDRVAWCRSTRNFEQTDIDAEVAGNAVEPRCVTVTNGAELPLLAVAVELAKHHRSLGRGVLGQVVAGQLAATRRIDDPDERVPDLTEGLAASVPLVYRDREDDRPHGRRNRAQVDVDDLVITLALTGQVV